jgi:16S rRNA (guanine527-N7)-methyltransferase
MYERMRWRLVDAWARRVVGLAAAVESLGLAPRVRAVHARAEDLGRTADRAAADLVVARSFAPPPLTAEYGAPLLRPGGWLVVSTSPSGNEGPDEIAAVGLGPARRWRSGESGYVGYRRSAAVPDRFPRRPAAQRRHPLF